MKLEFRLVIVTSRRDCRSLPAPEHFQLQTGRRHACLRVEQRTALWQTLRQHLLDLSSQSSTARNCISWASDYICFGRMFQIIASFHSPVRFMPADIRTV